MTACDTATAELLIS